MLITMTSQQNHNIKATRVERKIAQIKIARITQKFVPTFSSYKGKKADTPVKIHNHSRL